MRSSRLLIPAVLTVASLFGPGALAADRTPGTASVTLAVDAATCSFTVTAAWSNLGTTGYVDLYIDEQEAPFLIYRHRVSPVNLASGTASYTFRLTAAPETHSWAGQEMISRTNGKSTPYGVSSEFSAVQQVTGCSNS